MAASASSTLTLEAPPGSYALLRIGGADVFARRHGSPAIELHHSVRFLEMHSLEADAPLGGTLAELAIVGGETTASEGSSELRLADGPDEVHLLQVGKMELAPSLASRL